MPEFAPLLLWPAACDATIGVPLTSVWDSTSAPRNIDAPITQAVPEPHRWMSNLDSVEARLGLMGRAGTQAVFGEPVIVVGERDGWTEVRLPWQPTSSDPVGYPGWIPSAHIIEWSGSPEFAIETRRLRHQDTTLSIGSAHTSLSSDASMPTLREQLEQFLGVQYLWTGMSGWGVDCSGLIHIAARSVGLLVPRDSFDQFAATERGEIQLSLRFFAHPEGHERAGCTRHVAYDLGDGTMLHAPRAGFVVEVIPVTTEPYRSDERTPKQL